MFHATSTWMSFEWFFRSSRTDFHRKFQMRTLNLNTIFDLICICSSYEIIGETALTPKWIGARVFHEGQRWSAFDEHEFGSHATSVVRAFMKMTKFVKVNANGTFMANQSIHNVLAWIPTAHANMASNRFPESWFFTTFSRWCSPFIRVKEICHMH